MEPGTHSEASARGNGRASTRSGGIAVGPGLANRIGAGLAATRGALEDALAGAGAQARLEAMAAVLALLPRLRRHLDEPASEDLPGVRFTATIEFATRDGQLALHARFGGGRMRVRRGPAPGGAGTTVRFRDRAALRRFFAGEDTLAMLLDGGMVLEGNLGALLKFAYLSTLIARRGRIAAPRPRPGEGSWPADWRALPDPPRGTPARERPDGEVTHLGDPHLAAIGLSDLPRVKRLLWVCRTTRPAVCAERARILTAFATHADRGEPPVLRQARAIEAILSRRRAIIHEDDLLAGTTTSKRIGIIIFPELGGLGLWPELLTLPGREQNPYDISEEEVAVLGHEVYPYWIEENLRDWTKAHAHDRLPLELDERFVLYFLWKTQAASHTVIDLPRALRRGLLSLQAEAAEREARTGTAERPFYAALRIALAGVLAYATHLAEEAEAQLAREPSSERRARLAEMARICRKVPAHPPESFHEAIQALWILFACQHQENMGAGLVVGRLDLWLEPYLARELAAATSAEERERRVRDALELCCALMLKLTDHLPMVPDLGNRLFGGSSENQVITLGGVRADGSSAVNDLTWIFLKATELLHLRDPNINARVAPGVTSDAYLRRLCEVNRLTRATPSLHNDAAVVPALEAQGFSLEHARDWTATGCVEPTSCGRHFGHTNCMLVNLVAPLEMALRDGLHPLCGERLGPRTGDAASFASYEELRAAYFAQLGWVIDRAVEANNLLGRAHQTLKPTPLLSALFDGPLERGRDVTAGGALYNTSGAAMIGLTDVVDSLAAVKTLVFARREVELATLLAALEADFAGHELLLARILSRVPKFGQEHELPTQIAREVQRFVFDRFQAQPHYRGGRYLPGYWSMSNHVAFGLLSGALPSGRRRGKPFTPGLTPSPSAGAPLTEQIHAVASLDPVLQPNNIAFNLKLVPGAADTPEALVERMAAMAGAYFELGGMQMQFNVVSSATLRDAMEHPERYADLLVRISGYNAYFVELNRDIQLELVERAEHRLEG